MSNDVTIYHCGNCRPIKVVHGKYHTDPVQIFAERIARRYYGKAARVGALRLDSWTPDGMTATYEAFVGRRASDGNGICGHNVWLVVTKSH